MPNIRTSTSRGPCDCPPDGYTSGSDVAAVDFINGNPAEWGTYTAAVEDFGIDRDDTSESADLRDLLGLPDNGADSSGNVTLTFKCGSGIKVDPTDNNYGIWKAHRLDCGCGAYSCETGTEGLSSISCTLDSFRDDQGELDFNCDKVTMIPIMVLRETYGVGNGTRLDGSIPNLMFLDSAISNAVSVYDGIPTTGSFTNYIDTYGIIYSASWTISGDTIDITFTTKDPRIPGEPEQGRVVKIGNSVRVFKTGYVTTIRQKIRVIDGGYVIIGQGEKVEVKEFQTTFGCSDIIPSDPFVFHVDTNVLEQVEMIITDVSTSGGGDAVVVDPENSSEEFTWYPVLLPEGTNPTTGFRLFDGGCFGPISTLPTPSE